MHADFRLTPPDISRHADDISYAAIDFATAISFSAMASLPLMDMSCRFCHFHLFSFSLYFIQIDTPTSCQSRHFSQPPPAAPGWPPAATAFRLMSAAMADISRQLSRHYAMLLFSCHFEAPAAAIRRRRQMPLAIFADD